MLNSIKAIFPTATITKNSSKYIITLRKGDITLNNILSKDTRRYLFRRGFTTMSKYEACSPRWMAGADLLKMFKLDDIMNKFDVGYTIRLGNISEPFYTTRSRTTTKYDIAKIIFPNADIFYLNRILHINIHKDDILTEKYIAEHMTWDKDASELNNKGYYGFEYQCARCLFNGELLKKIDMVVSMIKTINPNVEINMSFGTENSKF